MGREHNRWIARVWALAASALMILHSARCEVGSADPLVAAGEQSLVGTYKLDNVLLAPGKLVTLPNSDPMFKDMGDTPQQAAQKGLLNARQVAVLQRQDCIMKILADHNFVITNLPSADLAQTLTVKGTWSMQVYHVFDTYGYRISLKCAGSKDAALRAKFFNADKPNPPIVQIFYEDGKKDPVIFRFAHPAANK